MAEPNGPYGTTSLTSIVSGSSTITAPRRRAVAAERASDTERFTAPQTAISRSPPPARWTWGVTNTTRSRAFVAINAGSKPVMRTTSTASPSAARFGRNTAASSPVVKSVVGTT